MSSHPIANGLDEVLDFLEQRTQKHQLHAFSLQVSDMAEAAQRHYFSEAVCRCALWRADDLNFGDNKQRQGYILKMAFYGIGDSVNAALPEHSLSFYFTRDDDDKIIDVMELRLMSVH